MVEISDEYIRGLYGELPREYVENLKAAMSKYGDNRWWESDDPVTVARHQVFENILMVVNKDAYGRGLNLILDRSVRDVEFMFDLDNLREEVKIGLRRYEKGVRVSEEYRETAEQKAVQLVLRLCEEYGVPLIGTNFEEPSERDEDGIDRSGEEGWLG